MNKSNTKLKITGQQDSYGRSTRVSSTKKLARDLREQFDKYSLKEQKQQSGSSNNEFNEDPQQNIQQQQQYVEEDQPQKQEQRKDKNSNTVMKSSLRQLNKSKSKQKITSKVRQNVHTISNQPIAQVPKSYLIAMQHLQDLVQTKNQQINQLKEELLQKQQVILDCEERINEILNKYHSLMDMYSLKENQVTILKQQMQELRNDKDIALRQAARAIQPQFKSYPSVEMGFSTFKQRSVSTNGISIPREPLTTIMQSKQLINAESKDILQRSRQNMSQFDKGATSSFFMSKNLLDHSASKTPLFSSKPKDRDFISYQRQIIRNQKQLIALKYRMECLQRKLSTNPKQDNVKQKIRTLSQQIQLKEKTINDLKKI